MIGPDLIYILIAALSVGFVAALILALMILCFFQL